MFPEKELKKPAPFPLTPFGIRPEKSPLHTTDPEFPPSPGGSIESVAGNI
jgi:hypothetical protein